MRTVLAAITLCLLLAANLRADDLADTARVRKAFDNCFWDSSLSQIKTNTTSDINMVAENAFQACLSEERAMRLWLAVNNANVATIEAAVFRDQTTAKARTSRDRKKPSKISLKKSAPRNARGAGSGAAPIQPGGRGTTRQAFAHRWRVCCRGSWDCGWYDWPKLKTIR
jgi:hypothetical protein